MADMKIIAGLDIGNGYVKGSMQGDKGVSHVDIPAGVALVTRPAFVPAPDTTALSAVRGSAEHDFFNTLDVSFITPVVPDTYRRIFGSRGLSAGGSFEEFNVKGHISKAEQDLSKVLVLGLIAGKALQDHVLEHKKLPDNGMLSVTAYVALALPITEYNHHRHSYAASFTNTVHTVTLHNFETAITVKVKFAKVHVLAEGMSAQYAIVLKGEPLMNAMLTDLRARGVALEGITARDILNAQNTIGVDIGEGTVNFPVFTDGKENVDSSATFAKGYGHVLEDALESMEVQGFHGGFTSRKQLAAFLQTQPSNLKRNFYNKVEAFVNEQVVFFCREVGRHFGDVLNKVGAQTEVVYVYGGGSGPIKDVLYPVLMDKVREVAGMDDAITVLYLDPQYSRHLNRSGLFAAAEAIAGVKKKG